jgi:hypothetical protein
MKDTPRKRRLIATYWTRDLGAWAAAFGQDTRGVCDAGIEVVRIKLKHHPRRNADYPYRVSLTAKVTDRAAAVAFMKAQVPIAQKAGVQMASVRNRWYDASGS